MSPTVFIAITHAKQVAIASRPAIFSRHSMPLYLACGGLL